MKNTLHTKNGLSGSLFMGTGQAGNLLQLNNANGRKLVEDYQYLLGLDSLAGFDFDLGYGAILFGKDGHFHLHGFEHCHFVVFGNLCANFDGNFNNLAAHGSFDFCQDIPPV
jgi:hypothetical protein